MSILYFVEYKKIIAMIKKTLKKEIEMIRTLLPIHEEIGHSFIRPL